MENISDHGFKDEQQLTHPKPSEGMGNCKVNVSTSGTATHGMEYPVQNNESTSINLKASLGAGDACDTNDTSQIAGCKSSGTNASESLGINNINGDSPKLEHTSCSHSNFSVIDEFLPAKFDDVISEEVELTIKRVIEESMQQVLGNPNTGNQVNVEVLTNSMEESLLGMISRLGVDSPILKSDIPDGTDTETKLSMTSANDVMKSWDNSDSNIFDLDNKPFESEELLRANFDTTSEGKNMSRIDNTPGKETDSLQSWKDAGKALRLALNKYSISSKDDSSSSLGPNTNEYPSLDSASTRFCGSARQQGRPENGGPSAGEQTSWESFSSAEIKTMPPTQDNCDLNNSKLDDRDDTLSSHHVACLTRSMHQSMNADPMNQMWEEYQSTQTPGLGGVNHVVDGQSTSSQRSQTWLSPASPVPSDPSETRDPSLSELRERMRALMSNLPITKNKQENTPKENESFLISSDSGVVRSPKVSRRRHHKVSKGSSVHKSDDEDGDSPTRRSAPKVKVAGHKVIDSSQSVQYTSKAKKPGAPKPEKGEDTMPDLVSDSQSDLNSSQDSSKENVTTKEKVNRYCHRHECCQQHQKNVCDTGGKTCKHMHPVIKHTESVQNFADVESTESERFSSTFEEHIDPGDRLKQAPQTETQVVLPSSVCKNRAPTRLSVSEDDLPSLDSSLSTSDEDELAASILREKYKKQSANPDSSDLLEDEDFELLEEIPELIMSSDDSDDENQQITLSSKDVAALQDINITDSSLDEEDGIEGDDEFECECYLCQLNLSREAQNSPVKLSGTGSVPTATEPTSEATEDATYFEDFSPDFISMPSMDDVDTDGFLNSLTVLTSETIRRGILDLMFTNVITHMLSVYPELLSDQTPEPLPPDLFETFPVIKISNQQKDDETSCPICLCPFELGEDAKQLPCDHTFHPLCIQAWLYKARTCPVCRHILTDPVTSQAASQH